MMIKIFILIGMILVYILISIIYIIYKKEEQDTDKRILVLEKRIEDNNRLIRLEIKGVLNNIELRDQNFLKYNEVINNRIKILEKKVKK